MIILWFYAGISVVWVVGYEQNDNEEFDAEAWFNERDTD